MKSPGEEEASDADKVPQEKGVKKITTRELRQKAKEVGISPSDLTGRMNFMKEKPGQLLELTPELKVYYRNGAYFQAMEDVMTPKEMYSGTAASDDSLPGEVAEAAVKESAVPTDGFPATMPKGFHDRSASKMSIKDSSGTSGGEGIKMESSGSKMAMSPPHWVSEDMKQVWTNCVMEFEKYQGRAATDQDYAEILALYNDKVKAVGAPSMTPEQAVDTMLDKESFY
jgi:hypothetical protein